MYRTVPITRPDTERSVMRMAWQKSVVLLFALLMRRVPLLNQRVRSRVQPAGVPPMTLGLLMMPRTPPPSRPVARLNSLVRVAVINSLPTPPG